MSIERHKSGNLPFANLPNTLKEGMQAFKTWHEKMIFLYGSLAVLSGLFHMVKGEYRQQRVHPNLFLFVLAEFASGKSALNYARKLVEKIHNEITQAALAQLKLFYQQNKQKKDGDTPVLEKPSFQTVLIPANITSARLIEHLAANADTTPSIMVESEIDTLTVAAKSEHGNFSDILRKGYHGEPVTFSRKGNNEFLEVKRPTFSLALAGTHNQLQRLISTSEDGLLSRFTVFQFSAPQRWSSVAPSGKSLNLDDVFDHLSTVVYEHYQHLKGKDVSIQLTTKQWLRLDGFGTNSLQQCSTNTCANGAGIVKRHALMLFKICLTLTALRMAEEKNQTQTAVCSDEDFNLALWLCRQSLTNSLALLDTLPNAMPTKGWNKKEEWMKLLPAEFTRSIAIQAGRQAGISARSVDRYLEHATENSSLVWLGQGKYKKP